MLTLWNEAITFFKAPPNDPDDTYREGFRSGWLDMYLGHDSIIARTSNWGYYAAGYVDGHNAYYQYNPVVKEGEITCLKKLLA
jgi:hypothetical protein